MAHDVTLLFPGFFTTVFAFIWLFFSFVSFSRPRGCLDWWGQTVCQIPADTAVATSHITPTAATCGHCAKSLLEEAI